MIYKTSKFKTFDNIAGSAEFNMSRLKCQSAPLHYYLPDINSVHTNERLFFMRKKWKMFINIYIYILFLLWKSLCAFKNSPIAIIIGVKLATRFAMIPKARDRDVQSSLRNESLGKPSLLSITVITTFYTLGENDISKQTSYKSSYD